MRWFTLILIALCPWFILAQSFNKVIPFADSLTYALNAEASVSDEQYSWVACFPGSRSPLYNRSLILYKIDQRGKIQDSLLYTDNLFSTLYSRHYPIFMFLEGDSSIKTIMHADDSVGRAIHVLSMNRYTMELQWQRSYRTNLPRDFIGSAITSACQIREDSVALLYSNFNSQSAVISILGDSGNVARQFLVGPSNPMIFQEVSFQNDNLWFLGFRQRVDTSTYPCVMRTDFQGNESFFYDFTYEDRIGLYGALMVRNTQDFGFLITRLKKKVYTVTGDSYDAGQGLLVRYDGARQREIISEVDSLSFFFAQQDAAKGNSLDAFLAGGDKIYTTVASNTTDFGYLAKVRLGKGTLWSRRYRYIREPGRDTTFTQFRFKRTEAMDDGGALAVGYFLLNYQEDGETVRKVQAWTMRVDSFGCVVPGCQEAVTSLTESIDPARLLIAPNPANDLCYAHWRTVKPGQAEFSLRDPQGRAIRSWESSVAEETFIIPMRDLPAGIYFLDVFFEGSRIEGRKIVKTD
jgi:hypothetical protein